MDRTLNGLLYSRKFWLACFALVESVVLHYLNVPPEIWQTIAALVGVLIASIAVEDAAEKRADVYYTPVVSGDSPVAVEPSDERELPY